MPSLPTLLTATAVITPQIVFMGVATGLRADILFAGFCGSIVAMVLLNTVPRTEGPGWTGVVEAAFRRIGVAVASCLSAGYLVAGVGGFDSPGATQFLGFVIGAGAQTILPRAIAAIKFFGDNRGAT